MQVMDRQVLIKTLRNKEGVSNQVLQAVTGSKGSVTNLLNDTLCSITTMECSYDCFCFGNKKCSSKFNALIFPFIPTVYSHLASREKELRVIFHATLVVAHN